MKAYCEFEPPEGASSASTQFYPSSSATNGAAWMIIQRRLDGPVSFSRSWEEYKNGFGAPEGEFWLGLRHLHHMTTSAPYTLRVEMWDNSNVLFTADYESFRIDDEKNNYRLHIAGYHGNATDALRYANTMQFSVPDRDNDISSTHCARFYSAGWWYKHCHYANLNGKYPTGVVWFHQELGEWLQLKRAIIKIRPARSKSSATNERIL